VKVVNTINIILNDRDIDYFITKLQELKVAKDVEKFSAGKFKSSLGYDRPKVEIVTNDTSVRIFKE
jgi:hypothetical protein